MFLSPTRVNSKNFDHHVAVVGETDCLLLAKVVSLLEKGELFGVGDLSLSDLLFSHLLEW